MRVRPNALCFDQSHWPRKEKYQPMTRRVVITGIGAVTPIGIGKDAFWKALIEGVSGVEIVTKIDLSEIATHIAAEVKGFSTEGWLDKKEARRMDRYAQFAVVAAKMAVTDANLSITPEIASRVGVIIGSGIGGLSTLEKEAEVAASKGLSKISPFFIPMLISNMAAGNTARILGAKGPSEATVAACATSTNSIGDAFWLIRSSKADAMVVGGTEAAVTRLAMAGFSNMKAMSRRNDDPSHASRPFDKDRDGFILGEGSGIVVLEELEFAKARGAQIYAEVIGYGMSNDAYDMVAPHPEGEGAAAAMRSALDDAQVDASVIDHINPHATSTPAGDMAETHAVKVVFGEHAKKIAISATKSMTGHLLGAAGAVELAATALAIKHGVVPPTMNLVEPSPECDLDYVPNQAREHKVQYAMSNSFGFGGHNATLVLKRFTD
jgi:3-oxoacyl-[acyl-carrier-protein] synthase II